MRLQIFITLIAATYAQFGLGIYDFGTGQIPGYSFEYHRSANIVLVRNSTACFIIESAGNKDLSENIRNWEGRENFENALYGQIQSGMGETVISASDLRLNYQDIRALAECFHHDVFKLEYPMSQRIFVPCT